MQKIAPFLWFDDQAEEAANYYVSIFRNSRIGNILRYDEPSARAAHMPKGSVLTISFQLDGVEFVALNGGPLFEFNESISFVVYCDTQDEIDYFWEKLSDGGAPGQCGWLKDKYGISWQVTPAGPAKSQRAMAELMKMAKIDIARLRQA